MRCFFAGLLGSMLLISSVGAVEGSGLSAPTGFSGDVAVARQTLGETYFSEFAGVTDYLHVLRGLRESADYALPSAPGDFSWADAETLRAQAANRGVYHQVLGQITTANMTSLQKVKAIYDFPMYNFVRYDTTAETLPGAWLRISYDQDAVTTLDRGSWLLGQGTGGCQEFSTLFHRLMNTAGFPCFNEYGDYVNTNGTTVWHAWNRAQVDGVWYWYDVDVEGSVYRRGASAPLYYLYHKGTSYWDTNHNWNQAGTALKEQSYANGRYEQPGTIFQYEGHTAVSFNDVPFEASVPLYGFVDIDSDFFSESVMLLPYFEVLQFLGVEAYWDSGVSRLVLEEGGNRIEFQPGSYTYVVNGLNKNMSVPIQVIDQVDYISADDLLLLLGYDLNMQFYRNHATELVTLANFQGGLYTAQPPS